MAGLAADGRSVSEPFELDYGSMKRKRGEWLPLA